MNIKSILAGPNGPEIMAKALANPKLKEVALGLNINLNDPAQLNKLLANLDSGSVSSIENKPSVSAKSLDFGGILGAKSAIAHYKAISEFN